MLAKELEKKEKLITNINFKINYDRDLINRDNSILNQFEVKIQDIENQNSLLNKQLTLLNSENERLKEKCLQQENINSNKLSNAQENLFESL